MTYDLNNRTAVVTGAASGIGAEIALVLARSGAKVALLARRADRLTELAEKIAAEGGQALAVAADVTGDLTEAVETIHTAFGRVDLVVNNAGVMLANPITEGRDDEWHRMIDTNLKGLLNVTRAFTKDLVEAGAEGTADLVNISSVGAHLAFPNYGVYTATKAAVTHLSANLRTEFGPLGVRVTNVEPGLVSSELGDHMDNPDVDAHLAAWREQVPPLNPADIGDVVGFVTSRSKQVNLRQIVVLPTVQV
ncbi:NADP-dependent 3-hydroxy acid dehydrogenase YdfG [Saccharothrix ecbatanensis]|uniref:NADP-dependent 3-hydroxy acid dehydrogenase YdfG n=1 Tax=Saccharothrix ecbatanensis TaxID=1105145 RepID=A0A7W9HTB1_9PSEU|nr:SDR family oxidoreductase [Saccharothrix ecbatanensis]MBB5807860.1 NADP-dependent 3-hydroxy acid dehydrogenase YdfG [Saccharothrix ecbatanensis]